MQDWCKDGLVVRAVVSHQTAPGWNPASDSISGLSLLLDVAFTSRGFSPGPPVFPSSQITALLKNFNLLLFAVSNYVGFGLMDAYRLVSYARSWATVPPQLMCTISNTQINRLVCVNVR